MTEKQLSILARRVKELRESVGISQQTLATQAGLSVSAVFQIEQGSKADPRVSTVAAIADALGVAVDDLLREASESPRKARPARPPQAAPEARTPAQPADESPKATKPARGQGRKRKGKGE